MTVSELVTSYLETWNETDPAARRKAIDGLWAPDGVYTDPMAVAAGRDQIDATIARVDAGIAQAKREMEDDERVKREVLSVKEMLRKEKRERERERERERNDIGSRTISEALKSNQSIATSDLGSNTGLEWVVC